MLQYLHEFLEEFEVFVAHESLLLDTHVGRVLEKFLVVCAHIQGDGQHAVRGNAAYKQIQIYTYKYSYYKFRVRQKKQISIIGDKAH